VALLVIDVQIDFCPGGALAVKGGDEVMPRLNNVIDAFSKISLPIFFTRDWHPPNHVSFKAQGGPWPPHCVMDTRGAKFHPELKLPAAAIIISKGTQPESKAYSGFQGTDLQKRLKDMGVGEVVLGGLATDYCVKASVLDALAAGFRVSILTDCVKGVDLHPSDSEVALREVVAKGARLVASSELLNQLAHHARSK